MAWRKKRLPHTPSQTCGKTIAAVALMMVAGWLSACAETRYVSFSEVSPKESDGAAVSRVVAFERDPRLLSQPPRCVVFQQLPANTVDPRLALIIEDTILRHLSRRVSRMVSGSYRDRLARERGLDPARQKDTIKLAAAAGCDAVLSAEIIDPEAFYALVIAGYRLGLDLRLVRVVDGVPMWRSRHVAQRSDGGLPLGFSALTAAWSASSFAQDEESVHSLVDDLARRLFATWPARR